MPFAQFNQQIEIAAATASVQYPGPLSDGYQDADRFRQLTASGTWLNGETLFVRKTVVNGSVGFGVMTPFRTDSGRVLFVQRGWTEQPGAAPASPGAVTITWYFDGVMDRAENYESMELALARSEDVRGLLLRDGWQEH